MDELKLQDAEVQLEQQEDDPAIARFQRRAIEAFEPKPSTLEVGQKLDVYTPFYRRVEVLKVADTSVIVQATSQVAESIPALVWREVWAVRQIQLPIITPMDVKWTPDQSHLIVIQENRPPAMRAASSLIAIDPKTETELNEKGEFFAPYRSIVEVMPVEEEPEAVPDGTVHTTGDNGLPPEEPVKITATPAPESTDGSYSTEITAAAVSLMDKYWGKIVPVPHKGNKVTRMDVVRYHKAQGEADAVQERSPEGLSVGEASEGSPPVGEAHAEGEELAPQKEEVRA